ncbi:phosphatase PAP2 family protein [Streptomyces sp.]|uniref:phosphatase PAP2 family protein n=1 Tax=Streptomyces sp. TaxID=1931 RepID=UPI002F3E6BD6
MGEPTTKTMNGRSATPPASRGSKGFKGSTIAAGPNGGAWTRVGFTLGHTLLIRLRAPRKPRLWFEILLIGVSYWTYSQIRNAVPEQQDTALKHAAEIWSFERGLGLAVEHGVNHAADSVTWLIVGMNYYYATLHFVITVGVLVWLYFQHPGRYGPTRLALFVTTWLALIGFYAYPLAPPRLMTDGGFIDTVRTHNTWGTMSEGSLAEVSNQYAAMPSMHIGWSLWCGVTIATLAVPVWVKMIGAVYPAGTLLVIVSTANHFWMDAVGGTLCLGFAYAVAYVLYGRWAYHLPGELGLELEPVR